MNLEEQLIEAAGKGDTETVALLLEMHNLALRVASRAGHTETVVLLLDRGANIHAEDEMALQWAAEKGHTETVALLLERGADIHADNDWPLQAAASNGHTDTVALLLKQYKTKDLSKWANLTEGKPSELAPKPFAQKELKKRMDCIKAQSIRDSEPEITL
jgi:ankyrin repeat protein